jgi:hypothetical protein
MEPFSAVFKIVDELNCPIYDKGEFFKLNDKTVEFPLEKQPVSSSQENSHSFSSN